MALEAGTYISDLVSTNPTTTDPKSQGDDHLRLIKTVVKATFPNITGAVTPTHTELNYVDGVTSAIQTQLDAKAAISQPSSHATTGHQQLPGGLIFQWIANTASITANTSRLLTWDTPFTTACYCAIATARDASSVSGAGAVSIEETLSTTQVRVFNNSATALGGFYVFGIGK